MRCRIQYLHHLEGKKDLGIHSELFSDGVMHLVEKGVITGARKTLHQVKLQRDLYWDRVTCIVGLTAIHLLNFIVQNMSMIPVLSGKNYRQVAINGAIEVDLTGQVCADSIGTKLYSGVGGQMDFIYGASRSEGGMPILALPSTAKGGTQSRIVPVLKQGAGVVTSRNHVHWIVTEYGAVDLYGKNIRQRVSALIKIAHPAFRGKLVESAKAVGYI